MTRPRIPVRPLAGALLVAVLATGGAGAEAIAVDGLRAPLSTEDPGLRTAGGLRYRGGLVLTSPNERFGGFSALGVSADGNRMVALSDRGFRFSARLVYDEAGDLAGLRRGDLGTLAGPDGRPLMTQDMADAEAMSPGVEGEIIVAFERRHRLWRYLPGVVLPEPLPAPAELALVPENSGIQALTLLDDGRLLALTPGERGQPDAIGWVSSADGWSALTYRADEHYQVTGAATLPGGDVVVIERFFQLRGSNIIRIKRVAAAAIAPGARLSGETIAELRPPMLVDNFEGIDARLGPGGQTFLYVISDDNFNEGQRTLLMMFEVMQ